MFAITFAAMGMDIWSLVIAFLLKTLVGVTVAWIISGYKPKFQFDKKIALELFHFGKIHLFK